MSERTKLSERVRPDCEVARYVYDEIVALENALAAPQSQVAASSCSKPQASAEDVLVRAYFHRFSDVEDDYTIYHTLDGVCEQCIPVLIVRASLGVGK